MNERMNEEGREREGGDAGGIGLDVLSLCFLASPRLFPSSAFSSLSPSDFPDAGAPFFGLVSGDGE